MHHRLQVKIGTGSCRMWKQSTTNEIGTWNSLFYRLIPPKFTDYFLRQKFLPVDITTIQTKRRPFYVLWNNQQVQWLSNTEVYISVKTYTNARETTHLALIIVQRNQYSSRNPSHIRPTTIPITDKKIRGYQKACKILHVGSVLPKKIVLAQD